MAWQFVGSTSGAGTSNGYTVSLNGTLTGGIASSPAEGDLVVVFSGFGNTASSAPAISGNSSGAYTGATTAQHVNDTWDTEFRSFYQVMGATPDTTLTVTRTTNTAYGGATVVHVWRGVDTSSPFIGAATNASGTNTSLVNPPAYNPGVTDALIIAGGAGTQATTGAAFTGFTGMSNFKTQKGDGSTSDIDVAMASYAYAGVSFDPPTVSGGTGGNASSSWAGVTIAFRVYVPPAQSLTPTLFDDGTDTFYAPTVTPGAVGLTPTLFDDSTDTFYSPEVTASGAVQNLTPALFDDSADTFHAPTVTTTRALTASLFDESADTFHAATVTAQTALTASLFDDSTDTFYGATATTQTGLAPALFDDSADTFYGATVSLGGANLAQAERFDNAHGFYTPIVTTQTALTVDRLDNTQAFHAPTVVQPGPTQQITFPDHVEPGWVESGWVGWPYFNAPQFFGATVTGQAVATLSEAAIAAIAAAVWARQLPLGAAPAVVYGAHELTSVDLDAIGHAVWAKNLP